MNDLIGFVPASACLQNLRILVNTGYYRETFSDFPPPLEVCFAQGKPFYPVRELPDVIGGYDVLVIPSLYPISNTLLDRAERLRLVCNLGAGYNNIDVDYARKKGISVCNTPDAVTQPTAELAVTLMAALLRRVAEHDRMIRVRKESLWKYDQLTSHSLEGKVLGIVGMGKIGRRVAEMAQVFRMRVVYYNPHTEQPGYERKTLEELLRMADVVSIHVPLSEQSRHLIGAEALSWMKPSAVLINTARGPVVDESALVSALKAGKIAGAALDVFENEPHVSEELYSMPQVVLTPHIGGNTHETLFAMMRDSALNVLAYAQGKPVHVVNPS